MPLTARQLNRATLDRQLLLRREPLGVVETVHRTMAVQAQTAVSPYVALWNRIADFDPATLDRAFADHAIVKATLMRATLHAVAGQDYPRLHTAMQATLRTARLADPRFTASGLSEREADSLVPELIEFARTPRNGREFEEFLAARFGTPASSAWWALRTFVPLVHAVTGGPYSFGARPAFVNARVSPSPEERAACLAHLVRRYLEAFGPATVADAAQFARLARATIRTGLAVLDDEVVRLAGPDGAEYLDLCDRAVPSADAPAPPRLLAMWDSVLLAYADRSRIIPPEYRRFVIRQNGDVLPSLLVDGRVAGVWRPVVGGIEVSAFHHVPAPVWPALADEARGLSALLAARDATVFQRYARWWLDLPVAQLEVLPGSGNAAT